MMSTLRSFAMTLFCAAVLCGQALDPGVAAKSARELRRGGESSDALALLARSSVANDARVIGEKVQALLDIGALSEARELVGDPAKVKRGAALPLVVAKIRVGALDGHTLETLDAIERSLRQAPKHVDLRVLRVQALAELERDAEAIEALGALPPTVPATLRTATEINVLHARGRRELEVPDLVERAIPRLERALSLDETRTDVRIDLARALVRFNRNERAEAILLGGLEHGELDRDTHLRLMSAHGDACRSMDRLDEARRCFERVLERSPGHVDARVGLARCHLRGGDFDKAAEILRDVRAEHPEHIEARLVSAEVDLTLRNHKAAAAHLRGLLAARPNHLKAQYMLARALRLGGDHAEAKAVLEGYAARKELLASR